MAKRALKAQTQAGHDDKARRHFEQRLLEERKLVLRELGVLGDVLGTSQSEQAGELSQYRFHMADVGTETMEREKSFLLASQEGRLLTQIDAALRRLYRSPETFGLCDSCGTPIDFDRLDALPHATMCIRCKRSAETARRQSAPRNEPVVPLFGDEG